jgi:Ca2+ transporting ATPase
MCVFNKRDPANTVSVIGSNQVESKNESFGVENTDLIELTKLRSIEGVNELNNKYGGIDGLAKRLKTDLVTGLSGDIKDINKRIDYFGKNEIPVKSSKSFFVLMVQALKEITLIILIVCALVSIGLSFYHPPDEVPDEESANSVQEGN